MHSGGGHARAHTMIAAAAASMVARGTPHSSAMAAAVTVTAVAAWNHIKVYCCKCCSEGGFNGSQQNGFLLAGDSLSKILRLAL